MKLRWKSFGAIATALVAVAGFSAVGTVSATAAPCTYKGCNGKDPQTTGCANDAVTKDEFSMDILIRVQLRWSPSCHAFWTRVVVDPENAGQGQHPYIAGGGYDSSGHRVTQIVFKGDYTGQLPPWTPMIGQSYDWERFCGYSAHDSQGECKIGTW